MATDYRQCPGVATFNTGNSVCVLDPGKVKAIILVMHGYKLPKTLTADALEAACHADRPGRIFPIKTIVEYAPSGGEVYNEKDEFPAITNAGLASEPITVGKGQYFVLGDNRNNSEDSRHNGMGLVDSDRIVGKLWFTISPWKKIGFV